jgi:hypothetical protein
MDYKKFLNRANATWKPFGFWSVSLGIAYIIFIYPILYSILSVWNINIEIPKYLVDNMMALVTAFLGSAGIRYLEKKNNITDNHGEV